MALRSFADVTVDDLFCALRLLGMPSAFVDDDRELPDERDVPMLLGSLQATVEMLAVQRGAMLGDTRQAWAAGYLQTSGVRTGCEQQQTFDLLTVRLQACGDLLRGLRKDTTVLRLIRALLDAGALFAGAASLAGQVLGGDADPNDPQLLELANRQLTGGKLALGAAVARHLELVAEQLAAQNGGAGA